MHVHGGSGSEKAKAIQELLESYKITKTFQPGVRVHPYLGTVSPIKDEKIPAKSHCSAFVFRVCQDLNLPMIGGNVQLLANLQHKWLQEKGKINGWTHIKLEEAEKHINEGDLVIAIISGEADDKPGHIAILRSPTTIIQAGMENYENVEIEKGFHYHLHGKTVKDIEYYAHATESDVIDHGHKWNQEVFKILKHE
jgi:hypothetical protein